MVAEPAKNQSTTPILTGPENARMNGLTSICLSLLFGLCTHTLADPPPETARYEFTQIVMGVSAHLVFYADSGEKAHDAAQAAFARLNELDAVMSDYRNDSELMRLCRHQCGQPVPVSKDLAAVLAIALDVSEKTDGAFDVTVGPVVQLWRQARKSGIAPDPVELEQARAKVGYHLIDFDLEASTVTLKHGDMRLDLGGIGKGFAADEALKTLSGLGIVTALVDLGGDISASNPPPGRSGWTVVVDDGATAAYKIEVANGAVATSGDLEQHTVIDGERYSHIVDPRTGIALTHSAAATVLASNGALADALASAGCVVGPGSGFSEMMTRFDRAEGMVTNRIEPSNPKASCSHRVTTSSGMPRAGDLWRP